MILRLHNVFLAICFFVSFVLPANATANETARYFSGVEGIRLASAPPPGFYYKIYNIFYYADKYRSYHNSQRVKPNMQNFIMVHRPIWVTNIKILDADFITTLLIPVTYADVNIRTAHKKDKSWALGDICWEFFCLDWHYNRWDAMFSLAGYIPTGKHSTRKIAFPGKGYWTFLLTTGPTFYLDEKKTWAISWLMRWEQNSKKTL